MPKLHHRKPLAFRTLRSANQRKLRRTSWKQTWTSHLSKVADFRLARGSVVCGNDARYKHVVRPGNIGATGNKNLLAKRPTSRTAVPTTETYGPDGT